MPLQRSNRRVRSVGLDVISFPMETVEDDLLVGCTVSYERVQDLLASLDQAPTGDPLADFEMVRTEIEQIASRQFDEGQEAPFVTSDDIP